MRCEYLHELKLSRALFNEATSTKLLSFTSNLMIFTGLVFLAFQDKPNFYVRKKFEKLKAQSSKKLTIYIKSFCSKNQRKTVKYKRQSKNYISKKLSFCFTFHHCPFNRVKLWMLFCLIVRID